MQNEFDTEIPRRGTDSVKWEFMPDGEDHTRLLSTDQFFGEERHLPMWVADMDFRCPEPVVRAMVARAQQGIYGYTAAPGSFYESVCGWMKRRHGWTIKPEWICITPGIVPALNYLVRTFVSPGNRVLIQPPVYHPFPLAIENNYAEVAPNPLRFEDQHYSMDFADLERIATDPKLTMAILCSPHNPVGRVWSREELSRFAQICLENDVLVVSDEIYSDLILPGNTFTPFGSLGPEVQSRSVICTAPSKTFNLAGLRTSCIIISDDEMRAQFNHTLESNGLFGIGCFGEMALQAAYDECEPWLEHLLAYLEENLEYLQSYLEQYLPAISLVRPEGTYLAWLDCRGLGLDKQALHQLIFNEAKVYLDEGFIFGEQGIGFERMNLACPRSVLTQALERIRKAVADLPASADTSS